MPSRLAARAIGFLGVILACPASASTMYEATILGKPDIHLRDGNVSACGMSILAVENTEQNAASRSVVDSSFYVTLHGGLVKGVYTEATAEDITKNELTTTNLPIKDFWFKGPGQTATQPAAGLVDSDTENALVYATSLESAFALFRAVATGEIIQIGLQEVDAAVGIILYGKVEVSASDLNQVRTCVEELSAHAGARLQGQP